MFHANDVVYFRDDAAGVEGLDQINRKGGLNGRMVDVFTPLVVEAVVNVGGFYVTFKGVKTGVYSDRLRHAEVKDFRKGDVVEIVNIRDVKGENRVHVSAEMKEMFNMRKELVICNENGGWWVPAGVDGENSWWQPWMLLNKTALKPANIMNKKAKRKDNRSARTILATEIKSQGFPAGVCSYGHKLKDGKMNFQIGDVCHARLPIYGVVEGVAVNYSAQYKVLDSAGKRNFRQFFTWLLQDSEFSKCFLNNNVRDATQYGIDLNIKERSVHTLAAACILSRIPTEFPNICELWVKLVNKGVGSVVALAIAHAFGYSARTKKGNYSLYVYSGHQIVAGTLDLFGWLKTLKHGTFNDETPYITNPGLRYAVNENLSKVHTRDTQPPCFTGWFRNQMNIIPEEYKEKVVNGGWGRSPEAISFNQLLGIAVNLQEEYNKL